MVRYSDYTNDQLAMFEKLAAVGFNYQVKGYQYNQMNGYTSYDDIADDLFATALAQHGVTLSNGFSPSLNKIVYNKAVASAQEWMGMLSAKGTIVSCKMRLVIMVFNKKYGLVPQPSLTLQANCCRLWPKLKQSMYEKFDPTLYIIGGVVFYLIGLAINYAIIRGAVKEANFKSEMLLRLNASLLAEMALQNNVDKSLINTAFNNYNINIDSTSNETLSYPTLTKEMNLEKLQKRKAEDLQRSEAKIRAMEAEIEKLKTGRNPDKKTAIIASLSSELEAFKIILAEKQSTSDF